MKGIKIPDKEAYDMIEIGADAYYGRERVRVIDKSFENKLVYFSNRGQQIMGDFYYESDDIIRCS